MDLKKSLMRLLWSLGWLESLEYLVQIPALTLPPFQTITFLSLRLSVTICRMGIILFAKQGIEKML